MPSRTINKLIQFDARLAKLVDKMLSIGKPVNNVQSFVDKEIYLFAEKLGIYDIVNDYTNNLIDHAVKQAGTLPKGKNSAMKIALNNIVSSYRRRLGTAINANLAQIETDMLTGLMSTVPRKSLRNRFRLSILGPDGKPRILSDNNIETIVNTSYANVERIVIAQKYAGNKKKKFKYTGGLVKRSSKQCTHMFLNQKKGGYTMEEIHNTIETPYGPIDWLGRIPNYNCIHTWK